MVNSEHDNTKPRMTPKGYLIGTLLSLTGLFWGSFVGIVADGSSGDLLLRFRDMTTGLPASDYPLYMICRRAGFLIVLISIPTVLVWGPGYKLRTDDGEVIIDFRVYVFGALLLILYLISHAVGNGVVDDLKLLYGR